MIVFFYNISNLFQYENNMSYLIFLKHKKEVIEKVAIFLGESLTTDSIEKIAECTSFSGMKNHAETYFRDFEEMWNTDRSNFFRKGINI